MIAAFVFKQFAIMSFRNEAANRPLVLSMCERSLLERNRDE